MCWFWRDSERQLDLVQSLPAAHPRYCGPVSNKQHPATDKLQRLLNASTHLVNDMRKFDHSMRQFMHVDLHWLDMPERVKFKLVSMCITAFITRLPGTWRNTTIPISDVASRRHLRSASLPGISNKRYLVRCASTQSQLVWASSICCCRPNCLELTERWSAWSDA